MMKTLHNLRWVRSLALALVAAPCVLTPISAAAAAPPTADEIRVQAAAGNHSGALGLIAQALTLKGPAADGIDRYELLMLKGQSLLQLGQPKYAADAFEDASEVATNDPSKSATAKANEVIVRRSPVMKYVPKTGPDTTPIDIKSPEQRRKAMLMARNDILASIKPKIGPALKADDLEPMMSLLPALRDVVTLEVGGAGELNESKPLFTTLGSRARALIAQELKGSRAHVEELNAAASEIVGNGWQVSRRGLYSRERKDLAALTEYIRQIESVSRDGLRMARIFSGEVGEWEHLSTSAADLSLRIETILRRVD
jgi:hypothetical protein